MQAAPAARADELTGVRCAPPPGGGVPRCAQVTTQTGDEVFFKIKRNTKLSKLQGAYANKVGKDVSSIR